MDDCLKFPDVLLNSLENGHLVIDDNCVVSYWNRWLSVSTQIAEKDIVGKNLKDFYPNINYKILQRKIKTALRLNSPTFYDSNTRSIFIPIHRNKITNSSINFMHQQVTISPYIISENKVMVSIYDISELHEAKLSLQLEMDKVNSLNKKLEDDSNIIDKNIMIMKTDTKGMIKDVSRLFCEFYEYNKADLIGKNASVLKSGKVPDSVYRNLWGCVLEQKSWSGEIENLSSSGEGKWVESRITPILDFDGNIVEFNAVYHDISNKKLLEQLYITDPLTKLYNRGYFDELMKTISIHQRKADVDFVMLVADIDHFKSINDYFGHQVGDEVLIEVAACLNNSLRDDDVVARWGGEEFVVMLKKVSIEEAQGIAEKLRSNIENLIIQENIKVTSSFGMTKYIVSEDTKETFKRADEALYEAKNSGRNRVVVKLK